jgi:hypothetical protein
MYAMVRTYTGKSAPQLYSLLMDHKDEVKNVLKEVRGLEHYDIVKAQDGFCTVTMCADKTSADESYTKAKVWLKDNAAHLGTFTPQIAEGPVGLHM